MVTCFEHIVQSLVNICLLVFVLKSTHNHTTFKYRCIIRKSNHEGLLILLRSRMWCYSYLSKTRHIFKFWTSWLPPFNRRICWCTSIYLISWEICESSIIISISWYWNMMKKIILAYCIKGSVPWYSFNQILVCNISLWSFLKGNGYGDLVAEGNDLWAHPSSCRLIIEICMW